MVPRSVQEQVAHEREVNFARRTRAAQNMEWMRQDWAGCDWTDDEYEMLRSMLGVDSIDPDDRPTSDVYMWSVGETGSR